MGTNRRYDPGYEAARQKIWSGDLGQLKTIVMHSMSSLFNGSSHCLDVANVLNNDSAVIWVQGDLEQDGEKGEVTLKDGSKAPMMDVVDGENILRGEPQGHGMYRCENGVTVYMMNSGRGMEVEAICERGTLTGLNDGETSPRPHGHSCWHPPKYCCKHLMSLWGLQQMTPRSAARRDVGTARAARPPHRRPRVPLQDGHVTARPQSRAAALQAAQLLAPVRGGSGELARHRRAARRE